MTAGECVLSHEAQRDKVPDQRFCPGLNSANSLEVHEVQALGVFLTMELVVVAERTVWR